MATNREVRRLLLDKLKITPQALSQRSKTIKKSHGPMTTEEAVYVIAHREGIDLSKHLPNDVLDKVRGLVPRETQAPQQQAARQQARRGQPAPQPEVTYPLVTKSKVKHANSLGAEVYPTLFILETSIRAFISNRLSKMNRQWWTKLVPKGVQDSVNRTMKREKRYPYREPRGPDPLSYANFTDLKSIVLSNKAEFQGVIKDFTWFEAKMDEVYMVRNNLAHCVPLSKDDISRIELFYHDWERVLTAAGVK
ncbi:MAG: hypothetical protein IH991_13025 [Planctomycetes bacterium]|nr:hypothetical protein [Planctomycetota bacterium]